MLIQADVFNDEQRGKLLTLGSDVYDLQHELSDAAIQGDPDPVAVKTLALMERLLDLLGEI